MPKMNWKECERCGKRNTPNVMCCCREQFELVMVNDNNADEVPHLLMIGTKPECIAMWQDRARAYKDVSHLGFPLYVDIKEIGECRLSVPGVKWAGLKIIVRERK